MPLSLIKGGSSNPYVIPLNNHLNDPLAPANITSTRQMVGGKSKKKANKKTNKNKKKCLKCKCVLFFCKCNKKSKTAKSGKGTKNGKKTKSGKRTKSGKKTRGKKMKGGNITLNAYNANPVLSFNTANGSSVSSHIIGGVNNHILNKGDMGYTQNETTFI